MIDFRPTKATKKNARLRFGLVGPSGSGKTMTSLKIASNLVPGGKVLLIDTEWGSSEKYADLFDFDVFKLSDHSPRSFTECIRAAEQAGYDVVVLDSLSHAWNGVNGALEQVDQKAKRTGGGGFAAWRDVTPLHQEMIHTMLSSRVHIIATMRAKTEYVQEKDEKTGKTVIRKVGLAPVQRDGMEYEFDVVADMDAENNLFISKTRCPSLNGKVIFQPGEALAAELSAWLTDGVPEPEPAASPGSEFETFNLKASTTEYLRTLLEWMKQECPEHPQKLDIVRELRIRKNEKSEPPKPVAPSPASTARFKEWNDNENRGEDYGAFVAAAARAGLSWKNDADIKAFEDAARPFAEEPFRLENQSDEDWRKWTGMVNDGSLVWPK